MPGKGTLQIAFVKRAYGKENVLGFKYFILIKKAGVHSQNASIQKEVNSGKCVCGGELAAVICEDMERASVVS